MTQIKGKILGGIAWTVTNQIGVQILSIVFTGILSRILLPSDFGMVAMVTLATGYLNVIKEFGFGTALVQKKEVSQEEYSSVFWLNLIIGAGLTLIVWFAAPYVALFYREPLLEVVTKALSFTFFITSASIVLNNMLVKQMEFRQILYRSLLSTLVSGIVAVTLALNDFGYWALVGQVYSSSITMLLFTYHRLKWRPTFVFNKKQIRSLLPFSLPLIGDQSLNYWTRNIDNLLIGRVFGSADLAFYSRAYSLMLLPVRQITGTITKVLLPSFSLIQDDIDQIRRIYLKVSGVIALLSFPLMIYLFVMSYEVILLLFGRNWLPTVPLFKILCLLGMFQSIGALISNVFISQGKTGLLMRIGLFSKSIMILGIIIGVFIGSVKAVAICYVIGSLIAFIPESYFLGKILKTDLTTVLMNISNQFMCASIMGIVLYTLEVYIEFQVVIKLFLFGIIAGIIYLALLLLTRDKSLVNLINLINDKKRNKVFTYKP